jgi:hypothetical protein
LAVGTPTRFARVATLVAAERTVGAGALFPGVAGAVATSR